MVTATFEMLCDGVADAGYAAENRWEQEGVVAELVVAEGADQTTCKKPEEEHAVDPELKPIDLGATQEVAAGDAEIRDHASDMGRAHR